MVCSTYVDADMPGGFPSGNEIIALCIAILDSKDLLEAAIAVIRCLNIYIRWSQEIRMHA